MDLSQAVYSTFCYNFQYSDRSLLHTLTFMNLLSLSLKYLLDVGRAGKEKCPQTQVMVLFPRLLHS